MKIEAYPEIKAHRERAIALINRAFEARVSPIDMIHMHKRHVAAAVKRGEAAPDAFNKEAAAAGLTSDELADAILSKPDEVLDREVERREKIKQLRDAQSVAVITAIVAPYRPFVGG